MPKSPAVQEVDPEFIQRVLDCPIASPVRGAGDDMAPEGIEGFTLEDVTVREYLGAVMIKVWDSGHSFDSKRPFGFSGWRTEIISAIEEAGLIEKSGDDPESVIAKHKAGVEIVRAAILAMSSESYSPQAAS